MTGPRVFGPAVARIGLICVLVLMLQGCFTIPPDVLRELDPPEAGEPNNFPPQSENPSSRSRTTR
jgi:hypothetical protein